MEPQPPKRPLRFPLDPRIQTALGPAVDSFFDDEFFEDNLAEMAQRHMEQEERNPDGSKPRANVPQRGARAPRTYQESSDKAFVDARGTERTCSTITYRVCSGE